MAPILELRDGAFFRVRSSYFTMDPHRLPFARMEAWYRAYNRFTALVRDPRHHFQVRLGAGDFVLYDNFRMMHARTGFTGPVGPPKPPSGAREGRGGEGAHALTACLVANLALREEQRALAGALVDDPGAMCFTDDGAFDRQRAVNAKALLAVDDVAARDACIRLHVPRAGIAQHDRHRGQRFLARLVDELQLREVGSIEKPTTSYFLLSGVFLALTTLTRSVVLPFAFAAFCLLLFLHGKRALLGVLSFGLVITPWVVRNSLLHHKLTGIETSMGYNLYLGYHPKGNGSFVFGPSLDLLPILDDAERDRVGTEKAIEFIRAEPERIIPLAVNRLGFFFGLEKRVLMYFYSNNILGYVPLSLLLTISAILLTFRTIGYGHDLKVWKDIVSALRMVGYDHAISLEHREDGMMSFDEGVKKGLAALHETVTVESAGEMFWA